MVEYMLKSLYDLRWPVGHIGGTRVLSKGLFDLPTVPQSLSPTVFPSRVSQGVILTSVHYKGKRISRSRVNLGVAPVSQVGLTRD